MQKLKLSQETLRNLSTEATGFFSTIPTCNIAASCCGTNCDTYVTSSGYTCIPA